MPRHDHDAGGDPELIDAKADLRKEIWSVLEDEGAARFPGAEGRIPNFAGASEAAELLRSVNPWGGARTLKANPDYPQLPVRQRALEDGKIVYMAVPKLSDRDPFFRLDPDDLDESPRRASSIKGASRNARTIAVEELEPVDLVVVGSVAVDRSGARLGKGGGFSDLEYPVSREAGLIGADTPVVTTVHSLQVLEEGRIPMSSHDVPLDWIVTPDDVIRVEGARARPPGIQWEALTEEKIRSIPLLEELL